MCGVPGSISAPPRPGESPARHPYLAPRPPRSAAPAAPSGRRRSRAQPRPAKNTLSTQPSGRPLHSSRAATCGNSMGKDMSAEIHPTALSDAEYHAKANAVLASVEARIDALLQDDVIDIDVQRTGGLLELTFPNRSKIVLNTQPPLHELWMAARAGGHHH